MSNRPEHRTKFQEFRVAVVMKNHWLDLPLWRMWENVTVRRPAHSDPESPLVCLGVVAEAVERLQITDADIANSDGKVLMRPVGGCIIGHSAIQEVVT